MKHRILLFVIATAFIMLAACSDDKNFYIKGTMPENRTMNIRIIYPGEDNINNVLTAARDGSFEFTGTSPDGAIVEVADNSFRVLARVYARNGDKIELFIDPDNLSKNTAKGNPITEDWYKWLAANDTILKSRDASAINQAVAKYIRANPTNILSTILLMTHYDATLPGADASALLARIKPEARPSHLTDLSMMTSLNPAGDVGAKVKVSTIPYLSQADTIAVFNPRKHHRALLAFTNSHSGRRDSIIPAIREAHKSLGRHDAIVDFWFDSDTLTWHRNVQQDSVDWPTAWAAGSVAAIGIDRLAIPTLPYFIVTDSTGTQLYRGHSVSAALRTLNN